MADKKPLYMDQTEGFSTEMASTDTISLGGLTVTSNSLDPTHNSGILMGGFNISNMADPGQAQDAATKAYVDSVAQGLDIKAPVDALLLAEWDARPNVDAVADSNIASLSGLATTVDGVLLSSNTMRVLLTAQGTASQNGIWQVQAGAWIRPTDFATGNEAAATFVIAGPGGTLYHGTYWWCSTVAPNDVIDTNPLTFARTLHGLTAVIDGVTLVDGMRVLVADPDDVLVPAGIWVVHTGVWTRPIDFATGSHAGQTFCFVSDGAIYADTGWVCTTKPPTDIVDTNGLTWIQFSSAGVITAGAGLQKIGQVISVKAGDGIETVSNSAATNVALATYPGLTLVGTSPTKKLSALVSATGGIEIDTSNGLAILINTSPNATIATGAGGVSVLGVPSNFTINGSATAYATPGTGQVTAANLDTLTAGSASNADSLHTHSLPTVPYAGRIQNSYPAFEAISAGDPVYQTTTNDQVGRGDAAATVKSRVIGLALTAQSTPGDPVPVVSSGMVATVLTGATAGTPYYLAAGGGLTHTLPGAGNRVIEVGVAKNATDLFVRIVDYGKKAA